MNIESFADELVRLRPDGLAKMARAPHVPDRLFRRMAAAGLLAGGGSHAIESVKAALTPDPYDGPRGGYSSAMKRGLMGGVLAALGLKTIGSLGKKMHHI